MSYSAKRQRQVNWGVQSYHIARSESRRHSTGVMHASLDSPTDLYKLDDHCEICGTEGVRLVRDHDHKTMLIRGTLCEVCNSRLGAFESEKVFPRKKSYTEWVRKHYDIIVTYLQQNKGYLFPSNTKVDCQRCVMENDLQSGVQRSCPGKENQ